MLLLVFQKGSDSFLFKHLFRREQHSSTSSLTFDSLSTDNLKYEALQIQKDLSVALLNETFISYALDPIMSDLISDTTRTVLFPDETSTTTYPQPGDDMRLTTPPLSISHTLDIISIVESQVKMTNGDDNVVEQQEASIIPFLTNVDMKTISVSLVPNNPAAIFLDFNFDSARAQHDVVLGKLISNVKILAYSRIKRWWQAPFFCSSVDKVPVETQLLLVEISSSKYAVIAPLIHFDDKGGGFRSTLFGGDEGGAPAGKGSLAVRVESGNPNIINNCIKSGVYMEVGTDPFAVLESAYFAISQQMGTFRTRQEKPGSDSANKFGFCSWDAFYSSVSSEKIKAALNSLITSGVHPKYVIIDDGWQQTAIASRMRSDGNLKEKIEVDDGGLSGAQIDGSLAASKMVEGDANMLLSLFTEAISKFYMTFVEKGKPDSVCVKLWALLSQTILREKLIDFFESQTDFSKRLISWKANSKFEDADNGKSLKGFVSDIKKDYGIDQVFCWHALAGYWGGISETVTDDLTASLSRNNCTIDPLSMIVDPLSMYEDIHVDEHSTFQRQQRDDHRNLEIGAARVDDIAKPAVERKFASPTPHLLLVEPALAWDPSSLVGVGSVAVEKLGNMYAHMHKYLAEAGVDGVKVDAQSGIGSFGGSALVRSVVQAVEGSVKTAFVANNDSNGRTSDSSPVTSTPKLGRKIQLALSRARNNRLKQPSALEDSFSSPAAPPLNAPLEHCDAPVSMVGCMCHSTENLYNYYETSIVRASDDFYPRDAAAQTVHIVSCAYNSVMLGEIAMTDWDMFHSKHECAGMHAAARAISGGPVYVSDSPGQHDPQLLRRLVLSDGRVLRTTRPGRPTRDCLFENVMEDKTTALKLWSTNKVGALIGAFNVQGSHWNRKKRKYETFRSPQRVTAHIKAADAEGTVSSGHGSLRLGSISVEVDKHIGSRISAVLDKLPLKRRQRLQIYHSTETEGYVAYSAKNKKMSLLYSDEDTIETELAGKEWDLFTVNRILQIRLDGKGGHHQHGEVVQWAPIGLLHMLNAGGAIQKILPSFTNSLRFEVMGDGELGVFVSKLPEKVHVDNNLVPFQNEKIYSADNCSGYLLKFHVADFQKRDGEGTEKRMPNRTVRISFD